MSDVPALIVEMLARRAAEEAKRRGVPVPQVVVRAGTPVRVRPQPQSPPRPAPAPANLAAPAAPSSARAALDPALLPAHDPTRHAAGLVRAFRRPADLLAAFVFAEALAPPIALREPGSTGRRG